MATDFLNRAHGGPGLQLIIYDSTGKKIIGRGSNFNWSDNFEIYPVEEWNATGINEFCPGKMRGSGSIGSVFISGVQDNLPRRNNFVTAGPYHMQMIVGEGRPNAGTVLNEFKEVWMTVVGGQFGAAGLAAQNVSVLYGERVPGADVQGVDYPVE